MSYAQQLEELITKSVIPDIDDRLDEIFQEIADNKEAGEEAKEEIEELREFKEAIDVHKRILELQPYNTVSRDKVRELNDFI